MIHSDHHNCDAVVTHSFENCILIEDSCHYPVKLSGHRGRDHFYLNSDANIRDMTALDRESLLAH
jgi:hypothetical protein